MNKEERLQKRLSELISTAGVSAPKIRRLRNNNNIISIEDFIRIKNPYEGTHQRRSTLSYRGVGRKTFERIEEIQKILSQEEKFHCEFCRLFDLRTKALASDDIDVVKEAVEEFSLQWLNVDEDLSYHKCILDGSWPFAGEILTKSLEKWKNHPNREKEQ